MRVQYLSPVLVGRDAESNALREAFTATAGGEPRTVLVTGESGVGKSRIVSEFLDSRTDDARVLLGGCVDLHAGELPYAPFIAALRGLLTELGPEQVRDLVPHDAAGCLTAVLPGINGAEPAADNDDTRARMFEYLLALLAGLSEHEQRPVILVIEDAHWADRSSLDLLEFLLRSQQAAPGLMAVVTLRGAELHRSHPLRLQLAELARLPWLRRIELARLDRRAVHDLVRQVLGREPDPEQVDVIHRRSEGNPLFAEELLRCELAGENGQIPPSLEDLLLDRVRRLPEPAARAVRVASVAGKRIAHRLLANVIQLSTEDQSDLDTALRAAVDAGVLDVDGSGGTPASKGVAGGGGYAFRHALIREAVYNDLLPGERTARHTRYAEVLQADGAAAGEVSHHLFSAGDLERGLPSAWQASRDAHRALAYAEELQVLECILRQWDELPDAAQLLGVSRSSVLECATEAAAGARTRTAWN